MPELLYFEICFMVQKETVLTAFLAIRCCMLIALKDHAASNAAHDGHGGHLGHGLKAGRDGG